MSWRPTEEPAGAECLTTPFVEAILDARLRDLGGVTVRRLLPAGRRRTVGPFIYFDHVGPLLLAGGKGVDVPAHPHIGLATVTYLFEGEVLHRDSLGSLQAIRPGDVNWMNAGRGIVHSERSPPGPRAAGASIHLVQLWVALPQDHEESEPFFEHHAASTRPELHVGGVRVRLLAGRAFGAEAAATTYSPLFYADVEMPAGSSFPIPPEHAERAAYVVQGEVACGPERAGVGRMLVLAPGTTPTLSSKGGARLVLIGGAPLDGERHIWWNFVSSSEERIDRAAQDWKAGRFPPVPGDDEEKLPLPKGPTPWAVKQRRAA